VPEATKDKVDKSGRGEECNVVGTGSIFPCAIVDKPYTVSESDGMLRWGVFGGWENSSFIFCRSVPSH
jgi:hypothetical protein